MSSETFTISNCTGITQVDADFCFCVSMQQGQCIITEQENCQRNDCRVTITAVAGRQIATATWRAGQPQLLLPVAATAQVVIVQITDDNDHR